MCIIFSLCNEPSCPGFFFFLDKAGQELIEPSLLQNAGIKGIHHNCPAGLLDFIVSIEM